jgi:Tol biopolymer transport system component
MLSSFIHPRGWGILLTLLIAMPATALQLTQITSPPPAPYAGNESQPAWSSDGAWIAGSMSFFDPNGFDPYFGILIVTPDGQLGPSFYPPVWNFHHPAWSPDGTSLAFTGGFGLNVAPIADPSAAVLLLLGNIWTANWSSNGFIAFERNGQIEIIAATGGTPIGVAAGYNPSWSSDGTKLAYDSGGRIWVHDFALLTSTPITSGTTTDTHPTWSPGGDWIAFTSRRSGSAALWVVAANGGNPIQLTTGATSDYDPAWSPDGTRIAFMSERDGTGPHIWIASDLPDFTVGIESSNWTAVKSLYRP